MPVINSSALSSRQSHVRMTVTCPTKLEPPPHHHQHVSSQEYLEAVHKDMKKHPMETNGTDLKFTESELGYAMKHLKGWMADQYVKTVSISVL